MAIQKQLPHIKEDRSLELQMLQHNQVLSTITVLSDLLSKVEKTDPLYNVIIKALSPHVEMFIPKKIEVNG